MTALPYLTSDDIAAALTWPEAVDALARALTTLDVANAPDRAIVEATQGQLLLMPAEAGAFAGVKVLSLAPGNPARGLPRAQGLFVLFDAETLSPRALLDGGGLTNVRTPAVSALAVRHLAVADAERLVVFGTGPQGPGPHRCDLCDPAHPIGRGGRSRPDAGRGRGGGSELRWRNRGRRIAQRRG